MAYRCVVGRCMNPDDGVRRCYYNAYDSSEAAYLDLCIFHIAMFDGEMIQIRSSVFWKPEKETP